jgi:hypothetical protein
LGCLCSSILIKPVSINILTAVSSRPYTKVIVYQPYTRQSRQIVEEYKKLDVKILNGMDTPSKAPDFSAEIDALERDLRDWWEEKNEGWGEGNEDDSNDSGSGVMGGGNSATGKGNDDSAASGGLWDNMPEIDSKQVARAAPICEKHLDIEFDIGLVQEGGYPSIDALIDDLVPKLIEKAKEK